MKPKYMNPFTDFGFKKLFGEDADKKFLIDFLNAILPIPEHLELYEDSLKIYRDNVNIIHTAFKEGKDEGMEQGIEQGIEQGKRDVARNLLASGINSILISQATGLSIDQIEGLNH